MSPSKRPGKRWLWWSAGMLTLLLLLLAWGIGSNLFILTGYVAKDICSCVFVAGRSEASAKAIDTGLFPANYVHSVVDHEQQTVTSTLLGMAMQRAVFRQGLGCALQADASLPAIKAQALDSLPPPYPSRPDTLPWPMGDVLPDTLPAGVDMTTLHRLMDTAIQATGTRALVVTYRGQLLAERYAPDLNKDTPILGWSMNKSITHALIGILIQEGTLELHAPAPVAEWQQDERRHISLNHLLQMSSGLDWDEFYFGNSDVTRMLFRSSDLGAFSIQQPLAHPPGSVWSYASGTTNVLSEIIERQFSTQREAQLFPRKALFNRIGMRSMQLEADASGTYVGSSFALATPRDWARFGLLYLEEGIWQGERILPEGWTDYARTPAPASHGRYGAHFWLNAGDKVLPDVPIDAYFCDGFNGQRVVIIPSREVVIVKMSLNPLPGQGVDMNEFISKLLQCLPA